jgi:ABC-type transport system substrate-binding protein
MYLHYEFEYPTVDFANVGLFKGSNDYELIIVLDKPLQLLKEDGSLDYKAAYNFGGLPLVQESKYEQYKVAPVEGSNLWTTTYNQSVESTSSWGPYKLVEFQAGKQYILAKNENWYGYNMEEYAGQYQTDKIVCEQVADWNTAWLKFLAGEVDSVSIDVSVAADYKNSEQAIYTPSDFVSSLQLQSSKESLKTRQEEMGAGYNKVLLSYTDFRKALSLGINRAEFANQVTTSSKAGFGLFNSMHYYDVANGGVYRNEDVAKQVLCDVYGVDATKYPSLSAAEEAITGFDLEQARALVNKAVAEAKAAGDYKEGDVVALEFGTGSITEGVTRQFEFIKGQWTEMLKGTDLEGKLELTLVDHQEAWSNDFRGGGYEVCMGGWSGAAWDPGYFLLAYLSPDYMYSAAWETDKVTMDFDADGDGKLETMSLLDWYDVLNGAHSEFNWGSGFKPESERLALIAALEKEVLSVYYTVPLVNSYSASLVSYKWDYITTEYNTFMGYGGIRYATYNYDDYEWAKYVKKNKGQLDYKG